MAWLLLHSEYAKHDEKLGRMAAPPFPDVYLEAVEETRNQNFAPANGRVMTKMTTKIWLVNIVKTRMAQRFQRLRSLQKRNKPPALTALFVHAQ